MNYNYILATAGQGEQSNMSELTTLEEYKVKGKEIVEKYCVSEYETPIMLPPAPSRRNINIDKEGGSSRDFDNEECLQAKYEAEVIMMVYRALEGLSGDFLILQQFQYTHHQHRLCDTRHVRSNCVACRKNPAEQEGDIDFLVIGRNFIVIVEVSNISLVKKVAKDLTEKERKQLSLAFEKSQDQGDKMKCLIESMMKNGPEECLVFSFSAFPSTPRILLTDMDEEQKKQIICQEDFLNFRSWWCTNVTNFITGDAIDIIQKEVKETIIAIWCTDENMCDEQRCSLGKCVVEIDKLLRKEDIVSPSSNYPLNHDVRKGSEVEAVNINNGVHIFRDIIGVKNLTSEQCETFNRDDNLLFINGLSAGSGKTIILLAKIIQLISSSKVNRAVFFVKTSNSNILHYKNIFDEADIGHKTVEAIFHKDSLDTLVEVISEHNNQVVMVNIVRYCGFIQLMEKLVGRNVHVFVDDCQAALYTLHREDLLSRFKQLSLSNRVWITSDLTQISSFYEIVMSEVYEPIIQLIPADNRVNLSLNMRSTGDLAGILLKIRNEIVDSNNNFESRTDNIEVLLPALKPGHAIQGPRTVLYVINMKDTETKLTSILNKEFDKLHINTDVPCGFKVGVVKYRSGKMEWCVVDSCYSTEYPAVIVLDHMEQCPLPSLYLKMSRARVYCVVIMITSNVDGEYDPRCQSPPPSYEHKRLLKKLKDSVRIIDMTMSED
ncbi:uncharacterized protein LOC134815876 [Bolinopsis microptera]|uniref:uncharacterized protein LOC134815876 n=1 Tax=Bolinopsis microptera TaxID=2820187 RepID=UPI00307A761E